MYSEHNNLYDDDVSHALDKNLSTTTSSTCKLRSTRKLTDIAISHEKNINEGIGKDVSQNSARNKTATIDSYRVRDSIDLYKESSQFSDSDNDENMSDATIHLVFKHVTMLEK